MSKPLPEPQQKPASSGTAAALEQVYESYQRSARKRRRWAADNLGNAAIRAELVACTLALADEPLSLDGRILDIGCGGGWLLEELVAQGVEPARLHGVDLLQARVGGAERRLPDSDIRLRDARCLPYPDDEFELVTLFTCLSSLPDRRSIRRALAEAVRVLAPGGLLLCYEPRIPNPLNRATTRVPPTLLRRALGTECAMTWITGFPPLARHLGKLTPRLYPMLTRAAPTHRLAAWRLA